MVLTVGAMFAGAGIYKWGSPTAIPSATIVPSPSPLPTPNLNRGLIFGLLKEYVSETSSAGLTCLTRRAGPAEPDGMRFLKREAANGAVYMAGKWTVRLTGGQCNALEIWEIDDMTGAIEYLGSPARATGVSK